MFVGITRAQQELQISTARYRDFRGQRKLTIPSSFLMELPRSEMDVALVETRSSNGARLVRDEFGPVADDDHYTQIEPERRPACDRDRPGDGVPRPIQLTTAATLANGGQAAPPVDPDTFCQGMWVLHATYGLGQIIALSGSASGRKATVDFQPPAGRKRLSLVAGSLQPVGTFGCERDDRHTP